ncbi:MAG: 23S rRNA (adenine(2503)-C(2))-methyltransferase RlmN [Chitinivibrionales bacterium]|nr:23S rRNA (adenine(2503)-C(2))-methyltransferase RlmN [Chitinivibrionales bacterium]
MKNQRPSFTNLTLSEVQEAFASMGEPAFRWKQVVKWVYQKRIACFDDMTNVAKKSRRLLDQRFSLSKLPVSNRVVSRYKDAVKFGFTLSDGAVIESVLLYDKNRRTICVSSQLGCGLGCTFCETGTMGFIRNLSQGEILGQIIGTNDYLDSQGDKSITNIVFMGMGEALSNYANFRSAVEIIMNENGFGLGGRKITVSTAGVVPSIEKLLKEGLNLGLAISLNSYNNEKRSRIMPVNTTYPLESVIKAAQKYFDRTGRRVTFEYVVVEGENDSNEAVNALAELLKNVTCKINLIPVNACSSRFLSAPTDRKINELAQKLLSRGLFVTIRKSRGQDISGACGQLSSTKLNLTKC